jgi:hypothetical protein
MKLATLCLLALCLLLPACERNEQTVRAAPESATVDRDDYERLVEARLEEFEYRFDGLEVWSDAVDETTRERLENDIAELRERKKAIERMLNDLQKVSDESWLSLKAAIDRSLSELDLAYNVVAASNR